METEQRPGASPEQEYTLTIEDVLAQYEQAGVARPRRRIQKYCARGDLDCLKAETVSGEKYLITPVSVERHIAHILATQGAAERVPARPDAPERSDEENRISAIEEGAAPHAPARPDVSSATNFDIFEHPYVKRVGRLAHLGKVYRKPTIPAKARPILRVPSQAPFSPFYPWPPAPKLHARPSREPAAPDLPP